MIITIDNRKTEENFFQLSITCKLNKEDTAFNNKLINFIKEKFDFKEKLKIKTLKDKSHILIRVNNIYSKYFIEKSIYPFIEDLKVLGVDTVKLIKIEETIKIF